MENCLLLLGTNLGKREENLQKAAQRMKALNVGMIPIYDGDRLVGMLTDRDITVRATAAGCDGPGRW